MNPTSLGWFDPMDQTVPVIEPGAQIQSKYPGMEMPTLELVDLLIEAMPQRLQELLSELQSPMAEAVAEGGSASE